MQADKQNRGISKFFSIPFLFLAIALLFAAQAQAQQILPEISEGREASPQLNAQGVPGASPSVGEQESEATKSVLEESFTNEDSVETDTQALDFAPPFAEAKARPVGYCAIPCQGNLHQLCPGVPGLVASCVNDCCTYSLP